MELIRSKTIFHVAISDANLIDIRDALDYQIKQDEERNNAHPQDEQIDTSTLRNISENIGKILCRR